MRVALAVVVAAALAVPASAAYRNPTAGRVVVLQIPGMHHAKVRRNVVYERSPRLRLDLYRSRTAHGRLPAVLLGGKGSAQKIGW